MHLNPITRAADARRRHGLRFAARGIFAVACIAGLSFAACADEPSQLSSEENVEQMFVSFTTSIQQIENHAGIEKTTGPIDTTTSPPSYEVQYSGCVDGALSGKLCVSDGVQHILVLPGDIHVISSVAQSYEYTDYANTTEYAWSGTIDVVASISVDQEEQTTSISGAGIGTLAATGMLAGDVAVDVDISGGRNYTKDATTLIGLEGTFTVDGEVFTVAGAFARE